MKKYDWESHGVEHLERIGCIINIREGLLDGECREVTAVEILPDSGWRLEGSRIIKETEADKRKYREEAQKIGQEKRK